MGNDEWDRTIVAFSNYSLKDLCSDETANGEIKQSPVFKLRIASSIGRLKEANELLRRRYKWRGYKIDELIENPHYITMLIYTNVDLIGTMTLGIDSESGLSVDETYKAEIDSLRSEGKKVAEITKLASEGALDEKGVLASLTHLAYMYAHNIHGCSDFVVEVHPRHASFYERMLGFQRLGPEKICQRSNAQAILLHLNLEYLDKQVELFGGQSGSSNEKTLYPYFFSRQDELGITYRLKQTELKG